MKIEFRDAAGAYWRTTNGPAPVSGLVGQVNQTNPAAARAPGNSLSLRGTVRQHPARYEIMVTGQYMANR